LHSAEQNAADIVGPQLVARKSDDYGLLMADFIFMQRWIDWCRHTAMKLNAFTKEQEWRARDVEMAVFQAKGDNLTLNPLPAIDVRVTTT
jgi:hypothetical protein